MPSIKRNNFHAGSRSPGSDSNFSPVRGNWYETLKGLLFTGLEKAKNSLQKRICGSDFTVKVPGEYPIHVNRRDHSTAIQGKRLTMKIQVVAVHMAGGLYTEQEITSKPIRLTGKLDPTAS